MICAHNECNNEFEPKTHNQKYCSDECCREATNLKIKQKYYEKKERLNGKKRTCSSKNCSTILSRYNSSNICEPCQAKEKFEDRSNVIGMMRSVSS